MTDTYRVSDDETHFTQEASRILRRLCETGAVLAVAADMDKSVVVRDSGDGTNTRTAVVDSALAQKLALKEWIHCDAPGRISRYRITTAGRSALQHLLAETENRARGMAEAAAGFDHSAAVTEADRPQRPALHHETPLATLARRRDKSGTPFLAPDLVAAGERLREDFELSQMAPGVTQSWQGFLTGPSGRAPGAGAGLSRASEARGRLQAALDELGPGLSDVALRCCCYLEGLEATERKMGWSSRSGKVVLRIALQRLCQYYESLGESCKMIG